MSTRKTEGGSIAPRSQPLYLVGSSEGPASQAPASRRIGYPTYPNALVGRTVELGRLDAMVSSERCRLVTVHGPGGMGKTRLVSAWAEQATRSGSEIAYAPLASLASSDHLASAVAVALGLTVDPGKDPADDVLRSLRQRKAVLVLDNLEHLLSDPRVTKWLGKLLDRCAGLQLVITSRERLGLSSEHVLELGGLGVPTGVELFEHRARQVTATFETAAHAEAVVAICELLEGVPLGIELAATWIRLLGPGEILTEIRKTLDFLTADARSGRDPRQSSMRAVFSQSWRLLREEEQRALARLSVFRGGFDRSGAERVAGAPLSLLAGLVDRSLVRARPAGRTTRYDMHELLRQFAAEQLAEQGKEAEVALAHAEHFVDLAQKVHPHLRGEGQVAALAELTSEVDNLRAAFELTVQRGLYPLAARIGWGLWPFWWIRNMQREGRRWMESLMPHVGELDLFWRTQATIALGAMVYAQGDIEGCLRYSQELVKLAGEAGDAPRPLAFAHGAAGLVAAAKKDLQGAVDHLAKSRRLFVEAGDPGIAAQAAAWMGTLQLLIGDLDRARESASAALGEALGAGDRVANASARYCLARIAIAAERLDEATQHLLESVPPSLAIDDRGSLCYVFELLGVVATLGEAHACGAMMFGASDAILAVIGNRGHTYYLPDIAAIERARDAALAALGTAEFRRAYEDGKLASVDTLVEQVERLSLTARPARPELVVAAPSPGAASPFDVRYFEEDDSIFFGREYLIKGVPGRILWRLLQLRESEGRTEFTNRELRLDPFVKLPGYRDNLEARLILLGKRLDEKQAPVRIERAGRGRFRLVVDGVPSLSSTPPKA